jgi:diguanylate cyclase (GGDEF)-like protein
MGNRRVLNAEELLEKIFFFMNEMVDTKDFSSTILLLTELGRTLANSERASFWYWDKAKKEYWTLVALDSPRITVPEGSGIVGASIENNETILINSPYEDERFNSEVDKQTGYQTRSILCIPVTNSRGEVIGAYQAINKMDDKGYWYFDERDQSRLTMAAVFCGKTLESQILYSESQLDQLTGLKNRRGYYEYYEKNIHPYLLQQSCSVIMADIDFFKRVNDTYGHNAGDVVLKCIAAILRNSVGTAGEVIRWGGEEFVILMRGCAVSQAAVFAEQIRKRVETSICYFEDIPIRVTMSFGVKALQSDLSPEENVKGVDEKLYEAKASGRNRVVSDEI